MSYFVSELVYLLLKVELGEGDHIRMQRGTFEKVLLYILLKEAVEPSQNPELITQLDGVMGDVQREIEAILTLLKDE